MSSDGEPVIYREPARSYGSTVGLFLLLAAGWLADFGFGGGVRHAIAWVIAIVIVVGLDAVAVRAARSMRSVEVTASALRVGRSSVPRAEVVGLDLEIEASYPVLGRSPGEGLPRGSRGLTLQLADGASVTVPVRDPDGLAEALAVPEGQPEIRVAEAADFSQLVEIERRADQLFSLSGFGVLPVASPVSAYTNALRVLVAGRPPVGFARLDEVDGLAHLAQLSVLPRAMRRGIGGALLDAACDWASARGYPAMTLITFADVSWNGPYYARHGFVPLTELTSGLVELRDWEHDLGLDELGRRVVLRRELSSER